MALQSRFIKDFFGSLLLQLKTFGVRVCYDTFMPSNEAYMQQAIQAATASKNSGGVAIGAVLVDTRTGKVIAGGGSQVGSTKDPTAQTDEVVKMTTRDLPPGVSRTTQRTEFALPATYFQDQSQYDVTEALKSCTKPKLFFYGTEDVLVSADSVIETYNLAAEPKMLQELQTEHDYRLYPEAMSEVNRVIGEFLDKYSELSPGFTQTVAIMANTPPVSNEELKRHKE
jgi:pimeloyl-ACP methyl ester carboxylesterase